MPQEPKIHHTKSTKAHRNTQRTVVATQLINDTFIAPISKTAGLIPIKLAQVLVSGQAFFKPKLNPLERAAHGAQASIALGQVILLSLLYFQKDECSEESNIALCDWLTYIGFFYNAMLLVGWLPAEVSKAEHGSDETSTESVRSDAIDIESNEGSTLLKSSPNLSPYKRQNRSPKKTIEDDPYDTSVQI